MGLNAKFSNAATVDKNYYKAKESCVCKTMLGSVAVINGFFLFLLQCSIWDLLYPLTEECFLKTIITCSVLFRNLYCCTQLCVYTQLGYIIINLFSPLGLF